MEDTGREDIITKRHQARWVGVSLLFSFLLQAGSGSEAAPQENLGFQTEEAATGDATEAQLPEGDYVLQPGDEITVKVFNLPELGETLRIRPDGKISLSLVDDVKAAGMSTAQLDELLTTRFSEFYRDPQVTIIVRQFTNQRVYVAGEVAQPGLVPLVGDMTALTAVLHAGGFRETASTDSVILLRDGGNDQRILTKLDLQEVLEGKADVVLHPFDVLYVPKSGIAKVNQFVDQYIRRVLPITLTGGFMYLWNDRVVSVPVP